MSSSSSSSSTTAALAIENEVERAKRALIAPSVLDMLPGVTHWLTSWSIGYPLDTIKTRRQTGNYTSVSNALRLTYREESGNVLRTVMSFYRGSAVPLVWLLVKRPFEFALFEYLNANCDYGPFTNGALAATLGWIVGCPFNVVKVRMQAAHLQEQWSASHWVAKASAPRNAASAKPMTHA